MQVTCKTHLSVSWSRALDQNLTFLFLLQWAPEHQRLSCEQFKAWQEQNQLDNHNSTPIPNSIGTQTPNLFFLELTNTPELTYNRRCKSRAESLICPSVPRMSQLPLRLSPGQRRLPAFHLHSVSAPVLWRLCQDLHSRIRESLIRSWFLVQQPD